MIENDENDKVQKSVITSDLKNPRVNKITSSFLWINSSPIFSIELALTFSFIDFSKRVFLKKKS